MYCLSIFWPRVSTSVDIEYVCTHAPHSVLSSDNHVYQPGSSDMGSIRSYKDTNPILNSQSHVHNTTSMSKLPPGVGRCLQVCFWMDKVSNELSAIWAARFANTSSPSVCSLIRQQNSANAKRTVWAMVGSSLTSRVRTKSQLLITLLIKAC
jgi:hypothetical protein